MSNPAKASSSASSTRQGSGFGAIARGAFATRGFSRGLNGSGAPSIRLLVVLALAITAALALSVGAADAAAPSVTAEAATEVGVTSALANGQVNPEEKDTSYHFEYITDAQFEANELASAPPFEGASATSTEVLVELNRRRRSKQTSKASPPAPPTTCAWSPKTRTA